MPGDEQESKLDDVTTSTPESSGDEVLSSEGGATEFANAGQEKPQGLKDKEEAQAELRKLGKTPSSKDLPQLDWTYTKEGTLLIQMPDKLITRKVSPDNAIMAGELSGTRSADRPASARTATPADGSQLPAEKADQSKIADGGKMGANVDEAGRVTLEPITIIGELPYHGEPGINREVKTANHKVVHGETLEGLAKGQLGKDAAKKEIDAYMKEIAHVNDLGKPPKISEGQQLKLPGHTADGGFVTVDKKGETTTRWPSANLRVDHGDHTWKLIERLPGDEWKETHGGSDRPEENFALIKGKDGHYRLADSDNLLGMRPPDLFKPDDFSKSPAHKELERLAEEKIQDPERLAKFRADMLRFEERIRLARGDKGLPGMEIEATYREIERLLKAEGNQPLKSEDRQVVAQQILSQAASPRSISQGNHETCNVTTVEARLYTQDPARAAQMVADVALTGKFKGHDGEITIDPRNLQADADAASNPPKDNCRSHASQIFQVTAVKMAYEIKKAEGHWEGNYTYEQYRPGDKDGTGKIVGKPPADNGDRLINYGKEPPEEFKDPGGRVVRSPNLTDDDIIKVNSSITGESRHDTVLIDHKKNVESAGQLAVKIESEEQLKKHIAEVAKDGKLPLIVAVDSHMEPFWSDSDGQLAAGSTGAHVITITGYDVGPPARVAIDNQWGAHSDHHGVGKMVPLHDLYLAMEYPMKSDDKNASDREYWETERIKLVQKMKAEIDANQADTTEKLNYLRLSEKDTGSKPYQDKLTQYMQEELQRWKQSNDPNSDGDHERAMKCFKLMLKQLSKDQQEAIVNRLLQDAPDNQVLVAERERIQKIPKIFRVSRG